jgi:hypothetical protein
MRTVVAALALLAASSVAAAQSGYGSGNPPPQDPQDGNGYGTGGSNGSGGNGEYPSPKKKKPQQEEPGKPGKPEPIPEKPSEPLGGSLIKTCERPTSTWSAVVVGEGNILVEAGVDFASTNNDQLDGDTFRIPALVRYGLSNSFEIIVTGDLLMNRTGEDDRGEDIDALGIGDIIVGTKWGLISDKGILPAIGSVALWKLPTADDDDGLGTGEGDLIFITAFGKSFDNLSINANIGLAFISDVSEHNRFLLRKIASVEVRVQFGDFTVFGEVGWLSDIDEMGGTDTSARVGAAYFFSEIIRVDASVRFGISEDADDFGASAGISILFGGM